MYAKYVPSKPYHYNRSRFIRISAGSTSRKYSITLSTEPLRDSTANKDKKLQSLSFSNMYVLGLESRCQKTGAMSRIGRRGKNVVQKPCWYTQCKYQNKEGTLYIIIATKKSHPTLDGYTCVTFFPNIGTHALCIAPSFCISWASQAATRWHGPRVDLVLVKTMTLDIASYHATGEIFAEYHHHPSISTAQSRNAPTEDSYQQTLCGPLRWQP